MLTAALDSHGRHAGNERGAALLAPGEQRGEQTLLFQHGLTYVLG